MTMTVEKSKRNVCKDTRVFCGLEISSDHFVVVKPISRHLKSPGQASRSRVEK